MAVELCIEGLSKRYPSGVQALADVSLVMQPGMFGLLGPNGAGKSTLMRILATLQEADAGRVTLGATDVLRDHAAVRRGLGYLPQEFGLYPRVTAYEMLEHFAALKGVGPARRRTDLVRALLDRTNLWAVRHQRLGTFSGGMKQRFGIAVALIGDPKLVIVDEPTAGLDPEERVRFHNLLAEIGSDVVVILSTHIVADVSDLCRRMAILNEGRVVLAGDPLDLVKAMEGRVWRRMVEADELAAIRGQQSLVAARRLSGRTVAHVYADTSPGPGFEAATPDLEDVYFWAVRQPAPAAAPPS